MLCIFQVYFETVCKFCGLASKLVLENMFTHASNMVYLVLNVILYNIQFFKFESWSYASER